MECHETDITALPGTTTPKMPSTSSRLFHELATCLSDEKSVPMERHIFRARSLLTTPVRKELHAGSSPVAMLKFREGPTYRPVPTAKRIMTTSRSAKLPLTSNVKLTTRSGFGSLFYRLKDMQRVGTSPLGERSRESIPTYASVTTPPSKILPRIIESVQSPSTVFVEYGSLEHRGLASLMRFMPASPRPTLRMLANGGMGIKVSRQPGWMTLTVPVLDGSPGSSNSGQTDSPSPLRPKEDPCLSDLDYLLSLPTTELEKWDSQRPMSPQLSVDSGRSSPEIGTISPPNLTRFGPQESYEGTTWRTWKN